MSGPLSTHTCRLEKYQQEVKARDENFCKFKRIHQTKQISANHVIKSFGKTSDQSFTDLNAMGGKGGDSLKEKPKKKKEEFLKS